LVAAMFACTILAWLINALAPASVICTLAPSTVCALFSLSTWRLESDPGSAWYSSTSLNVVVFASRPATTPAGSAENAESVGARIVSVVV
jgi:hypothetical protein